MDKSSTKYVAIVAVVLLLAVGIYAFSKGASDFTGRVVGVAGSKNSLELNSQESQATTSSSLKPVVEAKEQPELILNILNLRKATINKNLIETAKYYSEIDNVLRDSSIANSWSVVADCSYDFCEDTKYLELIDAVVLSDLNSGKNKKTSSLIETYYLWNSKNEALFSKSLTQTNSLLSSENKDVVSAWNELVECNGCSNMGDITLKIITRLYE